jgi:hypothetical protein
MEWNGRHVSATEDEHNDVTVFAGNYRYRYLEIRDRSTSAEK